jgi:3-ketoacyl-CoA synthase
MLVNKFKLRQDVQAYHLGGMGCGNGVMALGLLKDLLQVSRGDSVQVSCCRDTHQLLERWSCSSCRHLQLNSLKP